MAYCARKVRYLVNKYHFYQSGFLFLAQLGYAIDPSLTIRFSTAFASSCDNASVSSSMADDAVDDSLLVNGIWVHATRYHSCDDQEKDDGDPSHPIQKIAAIHDLLSSFCALLYWRAVRIRANAHRSSNRRRIAAKESQKGLLEYFRHRQGLSLLALFL
jgi:hypothetical protein